MMAFIAVYHPDVKRCDLPKIPQNMKDRIKIAIEKRLLINPDLYGQPLRRGLKGYRKLRVGDYKVIYQVEGEYIIILKIGHRKEVYPDATKRKFSQ